MPLYAIGLVLIVACILVSGGMIYLRTVIPPPTFPPASDVDSRLLKSKDFGCLGFSQLCTVEFATVWAFMVVSTVGTAGAWVLAC